MAICEITLESADSVFLPQCSDFLPVPAPACKGGQGIWGSGNSLATLPGFEDGFVIQQHSWEPSVPELLTRPDGSQCQTGFDGEPCNPNGYVCPSLTEAIVCPLGFNETCEENPNQSFCQSSSSSEEPSSDSSNPSSSSCAVFVNGSCADEPDKGCSIMVNGVCMDNPDSDNCEVMIDGICVLSRSSSSGEGEGEGGEGGDWAKEDIQKVELGVAVQTRDGIYAVLDAIKDGFNRLIGAILGLGGSGDGGGSSGSGEGGSSGSCVGYEFECNGGGLPSGTCDPRVSDCTMSFPNDGFGDTLIGITRSEFDIAIRDLGLDSASHMSKMSRILSDTSKVFPSMRRAIAPFNDYINRQSGGCSMTLDFSFDFGGFKCGSSCRVDLSNFGGKPIGSIISDIFTIAFGLGVLVRLLYVIRTIGQST